MFFSLFILVPPIISFLSLYFILFLQNSVNGKLSTSQLCLAYSTLVRSATMTSTATATATTGVLGNDTSYTLAWYCVQLLVDTIRDLSPLSCTSSRNPKSQGRPPTPKEKLADDPADSDTTKAGAATAVTADDDDGDRIHRLSLMLISTISSLPVTIMLRALDEVYHIIISAYSSPSPSQEGGGGGGGGVVVDNGNNEEGSQQSERRKRRKKELLEALFSEILEKIGDCEKEAAMKWWYTYRPVLISESGHVDNGEGLGMMHWFTKRWRGVEKKVEDVDGVGGEREREREREREKNRLSSNSVVVSRL